MAVREAEPVGSLQEVKEAGLDREDVLAVYREAKQAIERAREGGGPTLIESVTLRMEGHAVHDDAFYVPRELFEEWAKRDPIERFRAWLRDNASLSDDEEDEITAGVKRVLNDAVQRAEESPWPDPATLSDGVFATPEDAKGLLVSAIEDPNPVLYFEHKHLYRRIKGEVPDERYTTPFGKARVHREGDDVTLITWGAMVYTADDAATKLAEEGISVEILDLRTLIPWDRDAVLEGSRAPRGHEDRRLRRRDRGHHRRGGVRAARRAGPAARGARQPGAVRAIAREGVHPAGRGRRGGAPRPRRLLRTRGGVRT